MQESLTNQLDESSSHNNFQLCTFDELSPIQLNSRKDFQLEEQYSNICKAFKKIVPDKELRKRRPYSVLYLVSPERIVGFVILKHIPNFPNSFKNKLNLSIGTEAIEICFLAVDTRYRKRQFGEILLMEAILQSKEFAQDNPLCSILYLNAADEISAAFYKKQGLERYPGSLVFVQSLK